MKIMMIIVFYSFLVLMLIINSIMLYRSKGIIKEPLFLNIIIFFIFIPLVLAVVPDHNIFIDIALIIILVLLISAAKIFIFGYNLRIYYSITEQSIIDVILMLINDNSLKFSLLKLDNKFKFEFTGKLYWIEVNSRNDSSKPIIVSFKGWLNLKKYLCIRNILINKLQQYIIMKSI